MVNKILQNGWCAIIHEILRKTSLNLIPDLTVHVVCVNQLTYFISPCDTDGGSLNDPIDAGL